MRTISRPYGRFFSVVILGLACVAPRAAAVGGAAFGPPGPSGAPSARGMLSLTGITAPGFRRGGEESRSFASLRMTNLYPSGAIGIRTGLPHLHAFFGAVPLTNIADTVYYADGSKAQGSLLISWPAFTTATQNVVAAGSLTVKLGPNGWFNASLAPTTASTPTGVYYRVVYQLNEGGSFFQEWSALFVIPNDAGGRICIYYPRLQAAASTSEDHREWAPPVFNTTLHASLRALATTDGNDGEAVLCYRSYFPAEYAAVY